MWSSCTRVLLNSCAYCTCGTHALAKHLRIRTVRLEKDKEIEEKNRQKKGNIEKIKWARKKDVPTA